MGAEVGLSPEERVERVRMALAEAGWPDVDAEWVEDPRYTGVAIDVEAVTLRGLPSDVHWRAIAIAGGSAVCWPCWAEADATGDFRILGRCPHDPLTSPWPPPPEVPR